MIGKDAAWHAHSPVCSELKYLTIKLFERKSILYVSVYVKKSRLFKGNLLRRYWL